jgi:multidrug resistance efflux pump
MLKEKHDQHGHPDYDQRLKQLEAAVKQLQKQVQEVQHKLDTHHHPHTH